MDQMDPAVMKKLIELLGENERADQMANATASADRLRGNHQSFLGGVLGGAAPALGDYAQNKERPKRQALMDQVIELLRQSQQPPQMGAMGDFPAPGGGMSA